MINNIFILIFSVLISFLLIKNGFNFLKIYFLDKPNFRSSHKSPTPSGGGISFVFVSILGSIYLLFGYGFSFIYALPILCLPIAFVGFIDDLFNINSVYRFIIQTFSAILLLLLSPLNFNLINNYSLLFLILTIVSIVNFINFMDGADGLVASSFCVIFITCMILTNNYQSLLFILGALIGFLFFNWQPAKVFMGDVGSTFLGLYFAGLLIQTDNLEISAVLVLISSPLLGDASVCVIRRLFARQKIFSAHKLHLYQRLIQGGWSHCQVSLVYCFATLSLSIIYFIFGIKLLILAVIFQVFVGFYLDKKYASPFFESF